MSPYSYFGNLTIETFPETAAAATADGGREEGEALEAASTTATSESVDSSTTDVNTPEGEEL